MKMQQSLSNCIHEYVKCIIERVPGLKVLLLDSETTAIVSMVYSQTEILEKEVFLVEKIDTADFSNRTKRLGHLNAICFLRPTSDNLLRLSKELKNSHFASYYIFFSNKVHPSQLERLAKIDVLDSVKEVHEYYADSLVFDERNFSLAIPSMVSLMSQANSSRMTEMSSYDEKIYERLIAGLFSIICCLKLYPLTIRFPAGSSFCSELALKLQLKLNEEHSLFSYLEGCKNSPDKNVLFLFDRRDDPVTPLLNQWTYRAMVHELLGINNNLIDLSGQGGDSSEDNQLVLNPIQDTFYAKNINVSFGDLGVRVKEYVDMYQKETQSKAKVASIEDMQKFVEQYPEFKKLSGNVSKHVTVMHELSRLVKAKSLLDVSCLEQDIACFEKKDEHFQAVKGAIENIDYSNMEKLRLVLLYALRYEGDSTVRILKESLRKIGMEDSQVALVDAMLKFAGANQRTGELFQGQKTGNLLTFAKNTIQRGMKGVTNVYTQHKSVLHSVLDSLLKGKLRITEYSSMQIGAPKRMPSANSSSIGPKEKPAQVVAFVVGGATYEEACDAESVMEANNTSIYLGGSYIHNSRSFLADVSQILMPATDRKMSGAGFLQDSTSFNV